MYIFILFLFTGSAWNFEDDTDSTTSSETMTSVSDDGPMPQRTPSQLYYTTPPKVNMVRNQEEKRLDSSSGLYRITRRLSQKDKVKDDLWQERQRSVSLDWTLIRHYPGCFLHEQALTTSKPMLNTAATQMALKKYGNNKVTIQCQQG
ncbi:hypothetical protein KUTeg_003888 [Tegillarca granosa]|uniref:Uncharacterized protein n=1 Tax=Tegillarca granosa TaxID=220873 RepID=A0ABQ9FQ77_TEGGR|nr:hypothetical protein KUTeg_003888 [Tegillarca granosa]